MTDPGRVSLVVVSHSHALARAAVELASEMTQDGSVDMAVAAGLDETTLGTDAMQIMEAIASVDGPAGVVVLMDLGSAVLSAELALDLLEDPTVRERVVLSPAPIVEGLVVAAVAAAGGAKRHEVAAEARGALLGKLEHLAEPDEPTTQQEPAPTADWEAVGTFTVANQHGLHARPAARLVAEVRQLEASVELRNLTSGAGPVPGGSLSRVATLGALVGHEVEVRASGPQARQAVDSLLALAAQRFGESEDPAGAGSRNREGDPAAAGPLPGSPGIAIGPVRRLTAASVDLDEATSVQATDPVSEWARIDDAVAGVRRDTDSLRDRTARELGEQEAAIFDAHLALIGDAELLADVRARIDAGSAATAAWASVIADVEGQWAQLPDPYLRQRAADVRAVGEQVLRRLTGAAAQQLSDSGILVAPDLTPAEAAALDAELVTGLVLAFGSPSSHAAILARARGIPLVVAAGPDVLDVPEGTPAVLDGTSGELHIDPAPDLLETFRHRADAQEQRRLRDLAAADRPAVSRDGVHVHVAANLGSAADGRVAAAAGADGAGLVRTEFLFLGRDTAPEQAEQEAEYGAIADAMAGRPITLRTLDVGGDKPLAYLDVPSEDNPFLGLRGLRLGLQRPDLLREQLVAVCATARRHPVSVMFPMVSKLGELLEARAVLLEAAGPAGLPEGLRVGIMVEVPAAALKIESFLPHLDFVSIGTNDLTQYTLAAERGNGSVAGLSDALDPGVLQLIGRVCAAARGRADVAVCGEAGSDELAVPLLVGLGVRELSVGPRAVPAVKAQIRELDITRCEALAREALGLAGAADVRDRVRAG